MDNEAIVLGLQKPDKTFTQDPIKGQNTAFLISWHLQGSDEFFLSSFLRISV